MSAFNNHWSDFVSFSTSVSSGVLMVASVNANQTVVGATAEGVTEQPEIREGKKLDHSEWQDERTAGQLPYCPQWCGPTPTGINPAQHPDVSTSALYLTWLWRKLFLRGKNTNDDTREGGLVVTQWGADRYHKEVFIPCFKNSENKGLCDKDQIIRRDQKEEMFLLVGKKWKYRILVAFPLVLMYETRLNII